MTLVLAGDLIQYHSLPYIIVACVYTVPVGIMTVRFYLMATLKVTPTGLRVRTVYRNRFFRWGNIARIETYERDSAAGAPGQSIRLVLTDGKVLKLDDFWSKSRPGKDSRTRVQEINDRLNAWHAHFAPVAQ